MSLSYERTTNFYHENNELKKKLWNTFYSLTGNRLSYHVYFSILSKLKGEQVIHWLKEVDSIVIQLTAFAYAPLLKNRSKDISSQVIVKS